MGQWLNLKPKVNKFKFAIFILVMVLFFMYTGMEEPASSINEKSDTEYNAAFSKLEDDYGVKLGIYALDTETNKEIAFHADERFAYCSTFKALIVGAILKQDSLEQLQQVVKYKQEDVLSYAPITKSNVDKGMTIGELCNAALRFSDNTASNLLLNHIGGPNGFKSALKQLGDNVTQPASIEPKLNENILGDIRDTSTSRQLAIDLQAYTTGNILTDDKKKFFLTG